MADDGGEDGDVHEVAAGAATRPGHLGVGRPVRGIADPPELAATLLAAPGEGRPRGTRGRDDYPDLRPIDPEHYVIDKEIARGGMGRIMAAHDRRLGRDVAIKELLDDSGALRGRFEREARITARLQHPAIVNVLEAGAWPNGEPFYVMRLVVGDSLSAAIASRATLRERLGLLPNVIAAVDALAYAHSLHIIHRDLKPSNVLVGEFGETVVIDWGLAKDLDDAQPESELAGRDGGGETVAGAVMGTPAYMPPEQADGAPVSEPADVYALGAMLYHLLAGSPPYAGKSSAEILAAVIAGPPPPLASRVADVPPDLLAIVDKAMAHDARDRYPDARGLADDLKRFQTGQLVGAHQYTAWQLVRRWIGRHRTAVAVAAIALLVLIGGGALGVSRIVREQARTAESRSEAEDLATFMLGDLHDKLQPIGKLDLLDDIGHKAVAYYERRDDLSVIERRNHALAERNLGDVLIDQAHVGEALALYRGSLAKVEALVATDPQNATWQVELRWALFKVADALDFHEEHGDALAAARRTHEVDASFAARFPDDLQWQWYSAYSHRAIGKQLQALGDLAKALDEFHAERDGLLALIARAPSATGTLYGITGRVGPANVIFRRDLAIAHQDVCYVLTVSGDAAGALAECQEALALEEDVAKRDPENLLRQRDVAGGHVKLGDVYNAQRRLVEALSEYRQAAAIYTTLVANDPTNAMHQHGLGRIRSFTGDVLMTQGDPERALVEYRAYETTEAALVARDHSHSPADLALAHQAVGEVLAARGEIAEAEAKYRAALLIWQSLLTQDPHTFLPLQNASVLSERLGDVMVAKGDLAAALTQYRTEMVILAGLVMRDPKNVEIRRTLGLARDHVGRGLLRQGDFAGALVEARACAAISSSIASSDPSHRGRQLDLVWSHSHLGAALKTLDQPGEAMTEYRSGVAIAEHLTAGDPTDTSAQDALRALHCEIGSLQERTGDLRESIAEYRACASLAAALFGKDPTRVEWQDNLLWAQHATGAALKALNDPGAIAEFRAAIATCEAAARARPRACVTRYVDLGGALSTAGQLAAAREALRDGMRNAQQFLSKHGGDLAARRDLAAVQQAIAEADLAAHDPTAAIAAYQSARATLTGIADEAPSDTDRMLRLLALEFTLSGALRDHRDYAAALTLARDEETRAERLLALSPNDPTRKGFLEQSVEDVGDALLGAGDARGALAQYERLQQWNEADERARPADIGVIANSAEADERLGDARVRLEDLAGAVTDYRTAKGILDRLVAKQPTNADFVGRAAKLDAKLGALHAK